MERLPQGDIVRKLVESADISARAASAQAGKSANYVQNALDKAEPSIGRIALIADAYDYDLALINRETGEVDYVVEPPK